MQSHSHATHMNALWKKRHGDTYWLMLGWRKYWFPSQRCRDRGIQQGGEGILTHRSQLRYICHITTPTKLLSKPHRFKHNNHKKEQNFWSYSKVHLYRWRMCSQFCVQEGKTCHYYSSMACVLRWHVWHMLCNVVFTLVKCSEVNGGYFRRLLKKCLADIIDDAITFRIKLKSVSPLALCLENHTSFCKLTSPAHFSTLSTPL